MTTKASTIIRKTQFESLINDFEAAMNNKIDKVIDDRIREGSKEISNITQSMLQQTETRIY